jgi:hypothetical protein
MGRRSLSGISADRQNDADVSASKRRCSACLCARKSPSPTNGAPKEEVETSAMHTLPILELLGTGTTDLCVRQRKLLDSGVPEVTPANLTASLKRAAGFALRFSKLLAC